VDTAPVRSSVSKASVLLVDDEENLREAVTFTLERSGFTVTGCRDALEALEWLRRGCSPDVILLDLIMPRMDGWEFRLRQRSNPQWAEIPVVVLSADHSAKAAVIDAASYLPKPVEHRQLVDTVTRLAMHTRGMRERSNQLEKYRPLGELAGEIVRQAEMPISAALGNLQLAQVKAGELGARLRGAEAFSMVGIRQLLQRGQRAIERLEAVMQGTAAFAQLAGADLLRGAPRVLIVNAEPGVTELSTLSSDEGYDVTHVSVAEALACLRGGELFDLVLCELKASESAGTDFFQRLVAIAPLLASRVAFIVDGEVDEHLRRFLVNARQPVLRRPFKPADLQALIDQQLTTLN
jgi:two-component system chemotaxis response regulator CheY